MPPLSEPVQIQVIIVFGSIITAIVTTIGIVIVAQLNRTRQHAKAAQDQVQNSHDINLRDDLDEKFAGLASLLATLVKTVDTVQADQGGMKSELRGIRRDQTTDREAATADRAQAARDREHTRLLEQTLTPEQVRALRLPKE